jgi:hypothetical protein
MVNRNWGRFFSDWGTTLKSRMLSFVGLVAAFASIASFAGYTLLQSPLLLYFSWATVALLTMIVIASIPKIPQTDQSIAAKDGNLNEINDLIHRYPSMSLFGMDDVGKTTFLERILNRPSGHRSTLIPYFRLVNFGNDTHDHLCIIIDSVGGSKDDQFHNQTLCKIGIFVVDHAAGASEVRMNKARANEHRRLAKELADSRSRRGKGPTKMLIIANKSDLWKLGPDAAEMSKLINDIVRIFVDSQAYNEVKLLGDTSFSHGEGAALATRMISSTI